MHLNVKQDLAAWRREGQTRRRLRRWSVNIQASIWIDDIAEGCTVIDLSPAGARVKLTEPRDVALGIDATLHLEGFDSIPAEVRYSDGGTLGLMFLHGDEGEVALARYLVSRRPSRQAPRRKVNVRATLTPRKAQSLCIVDDISRGGASVLVNDAKLFGEDEEVVLSIEGYGDVSATVRRIADGRVGLMFNEQIDGTLPF